MSGTPIPTLKVEQVPSPNIKIEPGDTAPSPYMDEDDLYEEDAGDLDFSQAQQQLWLSHVPRSLWEALSTLREDEEIEIGTIRVEGPDSDPQRISLKLSDLPQFRLHPKEYTLVRPDQASGKVKRLGNAFIFSEKDLPGYKGRSFAMNEVDEDGNPSQGRSFLYEKAKRDAKKREHKGRFEPYSRRPIPKHTAIAGVVMREFQCAPIKNAEYFVLEKQQTESMLKVPEKESVSFTELRPANYGQTAVMNMSDKAALNKQNQNKRTAAKENRAARVQYEVLVDKLLELFNEHRIWGIKSIKARVNQPEAYIREVLNDIAFMWRNGDFNGKWELKPEYKERHAGLQNTTTVAPEVYDSEADPSGMEEEDENETFEDVT